MNARQGVAGLNERIGGADHVVFFHYVVEGECRVHDPRAGVEKLAVAGDLIVCPHGGGQTLASDLGLEPIDADTLPSLDRKSVV